MCACNRCRNSAGENCAACSTRRDRTNVSGENERSAAGEGGRRWFPENRAGLAFNDRFERPSGAERDDWPAGRGPFQRDEAEIFDSRHDDRARAREERAPPRVVDLARENRIVGPAMPRRRASSGPVPTITSGAASALHASIASATRL